MLLSFLCFHWLFTLSARETSSGSRSIYKSTRDRVDSKGLYGRWRLHLMGSWFYIITRKPLFNSILNVPYTKLIFKYASLPNLNFGSLQCLKNLCTKTLCGPAGNIVYHSAFLRQMHLILLAYSETKSCI